MPGAGATWTRREFVASLAAAAAAARLPRALGGAHEHVDVAIVGAGMSGLSAALALRDAGVTVRVLEASAGAGGRVRTIRGVFTGDRMVEAGAMHIHDDHRRVMRLADRAGLARAAVETGNGNATLYRGRLGSTTSLARKFVEGLSSDESHRTIGSILSRYLSTTTAGLGDPESPAWPSPAVAALDRLSLADFLRQQGATPAALAVARLGFLDAWGDGVESVSALLVLRELALAQRGRKYFMIRDGNDELPHRLAREIQPVIRYRRWVRAIDARGRAHVSIDAEGPNGTERIDADVVICAIPATQLRRLRFAAPLPADKQAAIDRLRHTSICRVFAELEARRVDSALRFHSVATDGPAMLVRDASRNRSAGDTFIIEAFVTGPRARQLAAVPHAERLARVMLDIDTVYPGARSAVVRTWSIAWDDDPFARGDYPWYAPGELTTLEPLVRRPEGRILFAGEQASVRPGWMEGAVTAGERAATEALALLEHAAVT